MPNAIRILVLEDDTDMRELLVEVLLDRGFEVVSAAGSEEALQLSKSESFDLIIADIRMQGLNGLDTIERAKQDQPDLGSIVISGYATEEETLRAVKLNVGGYLKKPFKMQELLAQINAFVAQKTRTEKHWKEVRSLKQALLWSLQSMGEVGEKLHPGKVQRSADVATGVAQHLGVASQSPEQLRAAAILHQLTALQEVQPPSEFEAWVDSLPTLRRALEAATANGELSAFAAKVCREIGPEQEYPSQLWPELAPELLRAYQQWRELGSEPQAPAAANSVNLHRLARTLEQSHKLEEAAKVYRELLSEQRTGRGAVSACLGLARLALAQRDRTALEQAVKRALSEAEKHGPLSLAQTQLEGAGILGRGEHPATEKLLVRACAGLEAVGLEFDHSRAVLRLAAISNKVPSAKLEGALQTLAAPAHLSDVLEHLAEILAGLLGLSLSSPSELCQRLTARLLHDYPQDLAQLLRQQKLSPELRRRVLDILEQQGGEVPPETLRILLEDSDPDIKTRALSLKAGNEAPPVLRVYSLGREEVRLGEHEFQEAAWKSAKIKHLFFYLTAQRDASAVVDVVLEEFWPGPLEQARNSLNAAVSAIRKTLRSADQDSKWNPAPREHDRLSLNPSMVLWLDWQELEKAHQAGISDEKSGHPQRAVSHFRRVAQLYNGPFLEGCYMDWALRLRERNDSFAVAALTRLSHHCLDSQSYQEALEYSARWLAACPDSQEAHHAKMQAHLGLEQPEAVFKQYESCAKMLQSEFGTEPKTEVLKTYHQAKYGLGESNASFLG